MYPWAPRLNQSPCECSVMDIPISRSFIGQMDGLGQGMINTFSIWLICSCSVPFPPLHLPSGNNFVKVPCQMLLDWAKPLKRLSLFPFSGTHCFGCIVHRWDGLPLLTELNVIIWQCTTLWSKSLATWRSVATDL